jgi:pyrroloquinoline quinone biosynthesis protein B
MLLFKQRLPLLLLLGLLYPVALHGGDNEIIIDNTVGSTAPYVMVLGIAQDGGYPQAGCAKACCAEVKRDPSLRRFVASLAIVDPQSGQRWIIDATPDFPDQLALLNERTKSNKALDGILLTHAHIGHYAGLIHLGREAMGTRAVPVYAMPRMSQFLKSNGPWDQLVKLKNIALRPLQGGKKIKLNERLSVTPLLVPHRDEYSETVGFIVHGPNNSVLWLPDIDKWSKFKTGIENVVHHVDRAYLDATFFDDKELPGRDMSEIPHPFIVESMERFRRLDATERQKITFIHLNHSNPALKRGSTAQEKILQGGFRLGEQGKRFDL